ncbi:exopolysaccharide biosynthesis polyprenyl glycosylphosphotransferase [Streptomyces himalayensis]|uniref:Exopolysaccharide biosynthesis polyprenyl glycosylphosphotransferase n=1 Tax=Streptomyces himalayensis subsp. himalayensis TaxID=2756131 RepID=A0A7W0DW60_9ACTN|nr:exopolysaccharide biosynthesis polyprenyl glycosylphosphotransferase [Streptomyces himalayensis]MBA2951534.1 exopolysaccharide biosynthesis polyprenyl glycosylphosphotransferase [Streptomyces himalayensis subsp. himalayensis]
MTMDSTRAPHAGQVGGQATPVRRLTPSVHPPRRSSDNRLPEPLRRRRLRHRRTAFPLFAVDALALVLTVAVMPGPQRPAAVLVPLLMLHVALHTRRGLYRRRLSPSALLELPALLSLALILWCTAAAGLAAVGPQHVLGWEALAAAVTAQTLIGCAGRSVVHQFQRWSDARHNRSTLIVDGGATAQQISSLLRALNGYGMRPVGLVGSGPAATAGSEASVLPVLTTYEDIGRAVIQTTVRHVLFVRPAHAEPEDPALVQLFNEHGVQMWLVDAALPAQPAAPPAALPDHLWGFSVRPLQARRHHPAARWSKRALDICLAVLALLATAPVMALCALAVRISDGPGVIFRQERTGQDGRAFTLLKFRTLRPADEYESATRWSVAMDHRMSYVGNLLRRLSLDELPQLWNVLRGDMSLVGPRPERPYFVSKFSRTYPGYRARHRMPVGITGLAQVNGLRGDTSIEDRARFDNHYIATWSLWQDVCILLRTAGSLFRPGGS